MSQDLLATLPLLVVLSSAILLTLVDLVIPAERKGWTALLAALGLLAALVVSLGNLGTQQQAFGGMLAVDGFSAFLNIVFLLAGIVGIRLAYTYHSPLELPP